MTPRFVACENQPWMHAFPLPSKIRPSDWFAFLLPLHTLPSKLYHRRKSFPAEKRRNNKYRVSPTSRNSRKRRCAMYLCSCSRERAEPRDQLFSENQKCLEPVFHMMRVLFFFPCFYFLRGFLQGVTHRGGCNRKVCPITLQFNVVCICLQRIGLTARRVQPKQYHVGNIACVASVSNRIIARKLERGQGGYNKALVCAGSGSIRKNNSSLKRTTTVTYNKFFSLHIRISNKAIFSCFIHSFIDDWQKHSYRHCWIGFDNNAPRFWKF